MSNEQQDSQSSVSRAHYSTRAASKFTRYKLLLLKKWWILAVGLVVGVGAALLVARFEAQEFSSVGRMIVNIKLSIPEGSVFSEEMSSFLGTQSALMQSGVVLNRAQARVAAEDPELAAANANWRERPLSLRVSVVPKTTIFVLQCVARDAKYAQLFLQSAMEEYSQVKREMRTQTSDTTLAGLTEEIFRLEKELRATEEAKVAFLATNSVVLLEDQAGNSSAANYLVALNQRLAGMRSELALLEKLTVEQSVERGQLTADGGAGSGFKLGESESEFLKAKQQVLLLKAEQADLAQYLRPRHPKMIAMTEEISRRERLLDIFRQQSADQLDARKSALSLQIANLEKEVIAWDAKALAVSRASAEFGKLKGNSMRIQSLYERLLATMQTLDVNKEISPESVTIMEKASEGFPAKPRLSKQLITGAVIGLALAVGLLLLLDRLDDRMTSGTELQDNFEEELLAQIPGERGVKGKDLALIQPHDDRHAYVEAYRTLRSSLLYMNQSKSRARLLLVTSSVPNDGKSLTSANLAVTMAQTGSKVLLVDGDMRKGSLHARFGVPSQPGLSEALASQVNWNEAVQPSGVENLWVLPRGKAATHSGELFLGQATREFLKAAAAQFEYVIIDTAPVMAADDVTTLAPLVEGVVFVIRAEQTSARVARAALDLLYQRHVNVLGMVFNSVRPSSSDYYYYKYKDYYRAYPEEPARK